MNKLFELSEETAAIVRYLQSHEKGTVISYADLSKAVRFKVNSSTPKLIYARTLLQKHHNAVWDCVRPKVGIRRLNDLEIAERLPQFWLFGARNKISRGNDQADIVDTKELDIDQQVKFSVHSIQAHLALDALSKATTKKIAKTARGTSNDLPSFNAVEWAIALSPRK